MATADPSEPRERRSLLKSFYGLETVSSEREEVTTEQIEMTDLQKKEVINNNNLPEIDFVSKDDMQDPVDINGKYFLSKKYIDKMLSECTLTQLDEENNRISQQVTYTNVLYLLNRFIMESKPGNKARENRLKNDM